MRTNNIFLTGGEVYGAHMIGYRDKIETLVHMTEQKLRATGGIYVYGLYRMGKTSVVKETIRQLREKDPGLICLYLDLKQFNTNAETRFAALLSVIVRELDERLETLEGSEIPRVRKKIREHLSLDLSDPYLRMSFQKVFTWVKHAGLTVLLVVDEFDAAREVFTSKADFELFRSLTASAEYSVCLVTVSRQELSMIEFVDQNNSSFKGVMYPFPIKGFTEEDIAEYCRILETDYGRPLSETDTGFIRAHCGSSPYLWSCVGYELAERQLSGEPALPVQNVFDTSALLSTIGGYHDSIYKCLGLDRDRKGVSLAEKLVATIIGPAYLVTTEDLKLLISLNYVIDNGKEYLPFSAGFKQYLLRATVSNDVLNNVSTLERKLKAMLDTHRDELARAVGTTKTGDEMWFDILTFDWKKLSGKHFDPKSYKWMIYATNRDFNAHETALNVMSLEDATRIIRAHWSVFHSEFHDDLLKTWDKKLKKCGEARNPVVHGSVERVYTPEDQQIINSYCMEILRHIS